METYDSQSGHRTQYSTAHAHCILVTCFFINGFINLFLYVTLLAHGYSGYADAPQYYVYTTLPVLFKNIHIILLKLLQSVIFVCKTYHLYVYVKRLGHT